MKLLLLNPGLLALLLFALTATPCTARGDNPATGPTTTIVPTVGAESVPDKSSYSLLNPTPAALMRDFNPNRPSLTEGPLTIDAGHFQLEMSFAEFTHDDDHGLQTDQLSVIPADIRVGILNNFEIDVMFNPYLNSLVHGKAQPSQRETGTDDTQIRAALNLWGNDTGPTAGGILAFVSLPTESGGFGSNHVQGGIILPIAVHLAAGFEGGAMIECDFDRNARNDGYGVDLLHTMTLGHALFPNIGGYIEYAGISPVSTNQTYLAYFDTGVTYALNANVQLDAGINIGLSRRADDFTVFAGLSLRI